MSMTYAYVMPLNENYVPSTKGIELMSNVIEKRNNGNLNVIFEINDSIQFYDSGENFENILCPFCKNELDIEWWQEEMSKAS
jgi:hypothetical protein